MSLKRRIATWTARIDVGFAQAFGARRLDTLALIFQRTVAFLVVHALGLSVVILVAPTVLEKCGYDHGLCAMVTNFSRIMLPSIFVDAINRYAPKT